MLASTLAVPCSRLALTATANGDFERASRLFHAVLQQVLSDQKVSEAVHVATVVSALHVERGNFRLAAAYLGSAKKLLSDPFGARSGGYR